MRAVFLGGVHMLSFLKRRRSRPSTGLEVRSFRPQVEELEGRALPSAAPLTPALGLKPLAHHAHSSLSTTSSNWSGYAAETNFSSPAANAVKAVSGSWTVPSVTATPGARNTYSSVWVGIDGYQSRTVEQIGTEQDVINGQTVYYAWYEMYPKFPVTIPITIHAGDSISASVNFVSAVGNKQTFTLTLTDNTTGQSFSTNQSIHGAKRSSAEWIVEAPSSGGVLPLANFGSTTFTHASATFGTTSGPIDSSAWQNASINMVSGQKTVATTGPLSDSGSGSSATSSFTVSFTG